MLSVRRAPELVTRVVGDVRLQSRLRSALDDEKLAGAREQSCLVVEDGDRVLFEERASERLVPASTMKVLTGMAALRKLGSDFRYETSVRAEKAPFNGVLDGNLFLVGAGDPLLETDDYAATFRNQPQVYTRLEDLADRTIAAGVREIRGSVVGDESRYDTVRSVPSWKPGYLTANEIGPVSALVVNDNFTLYKPAPRQPTPSPALHSATVLTKLLRDRGVITGDPMEGAAVLHSIEVASVSSPPLTDVVGEMLRESDNMTAEMLVKELGVRARKRGTWDDGVKAVRDILVESKFPADGYEAVDGSGLDVSDRITCALLMDALDVVGPQGPVAAGFAVAGRTGTLAERFVNNPAAGRLRAKTGSLDHVVGLTGFVDTTGERTLEFALLANALPDRLASGRALQERVGAILATYPQAPRPLQVAP